MGTARPRRRTLVNHITAGVTTAVAIVSILTALGPVAVSAQASGAPDGEPFGDALWWSVGVGGGSVGLTCDICTRDRDTGVTAQLGLGARARSDVDIGLELGIWTRDDDGVRASARRIDLRAIHRPFDDSGFHVIGGLGWVGYEAGDLTYDAVALSVGVGWDFPLSGRWRIGNRLLIDAASYGSFVNAGAVAVEVVSLSIARLEVVLLRR